MSGLEYTINQMKVGDIILFQTRGFKGLAIYLATKSDFTHAGLYIGNGVMAESDFGGTQINLLSHKYRNTPFEVLRHKTANEKQLDNVKLWALKNNGKGYDYLGVLGITLSIIGKDKHNSYDVLDRYWCSEYVMDAYISSGLEVSCDKDTHIVSPGDISEDKNFFSVIKYNNH